MLLFASFCFCAHDVRMNVTGLWAKTQNVWNKQKNLE